jgi:hypothetical protein
MAITGWVPDFDDQQGGVSLTLKRRFYPNGVEQDFGPYTAGANTEALRFRTLGRQFKFRFDSSSSPSFWRLGTMRLYHRQNRRAALISKGHF